MAMESRAARYRWDELTEDHPLDRLRRRRIGGERMMLSRVVLEAGCRVPMHAHENEQFAVVLAGRIRFQVGGGGDADPVEMTLTAGDVLHLPSNVPHSADAIEETIVLDLFSPPSEKTGIDRT